MKIVKRSSIAIIIVCICIFPFCGCVNVERAAAGERENSHLSVYALNKELNEVKIGMTESEVLNILGKLSTSAIVFHWFFSYFSKIGGGVPASASNNSYAYFSEQVGTAHHPII
jgi:hypothetical protein